MTQLAFVATELGDHDLLREFITAFHHEDGHPIAPEVLDRALDALARSEPLLHVWKIMADARAIGYVALTVGFSIEVGGFDAFVDELYVLPEARGQGAGREALRFVETAARSLGVRRLCLEVETHNALATALYRGAGYHAHPRHLMSKWL